MWRQNKWLPSVRNFGLPLAQWYLGEGELCSILWFLWTGSDIFFYSEKKYWFVCLFNLLIIFIWFKMLANATHCFRLSFFKIVCMYYKICLWIVDVKCRYSNWVDLGLCPCKNGQKIQVRAFTFVQNGTHEAKDCGKELVKITLCRTDSCE